MLQIHQLLIQIILLLKVLHRSVVGMLLYRLAQAQGLPEIGASLIGMVVMLIIHLSLFLVRMILQEIGDLVGPKKHGLLIAIVKVQ